MSRNLMPFFARADPFWNQWADQSRLFETHFGSALTDEDLFASPLLSPNYMLRQRPFSRQLSANIPPRPLVPQSFEMTQQADKFQVMVDVSHFTPEEISVKTVDNTIVVSAKHEERADDYGFISRQFSRRYLLPPEVDPLTVTSSLSPEGILTVNAPKKREDLKEGERLVPIAMSPQSPQPLPKPIPVQNESA